MPSVENKTSESLKNFNSKDIPLNGYQQFICFVIGIINGLILIASVVYIVLIICWDEKHVSCFSKPLPVSAVGGAFGGSLRAIMMLIIEVGQKKADFKSVDYYLSRWPLFILKPFLGIGTGVFFYLAIKFGFVMPLSTNQSESNILPIFFLSAVGGFFFEEVISIIDRFMNNFADKKSDKQLRKE